MSLDHDITVEPATHPPAVAGPFWPVDRAPSRTLQSDTASLADATRDRGFERWLTWLLAGVLGLIVAHDVYYLVINLSAPVLDLHAFRQAQTAITAYWTLHGGLTHAFDTPVLGYPWAIPFEFPLYQWLVAAVAYLGIPIDAAGRLVSFAFLLGCLWPLHMLLRALSLPWQAFAFTAILIMASPIYIYWGRTVMIETAAVFFGLLWLSLLVRNTERPKRGSIIAATVAGCCAVLVKATTFPAFGLLGGIWILFKLAGCWRAGQSRALLRWLAAGAIVCLVPLAVGYEWVSYSDSLKRANPLAELLTSAALMPWNLGALSQRVSSDLWVAAIAGRALSDIFGFASLFALAVCATGLAGRYCMLVGAAVVGFLTPILLFTNLHIVHSYYQVSNAICALTAVGLAIAGLAEMRRPILATFVMAFIVASQLVFFHLRFAPEIVADHTESDDYRMALVAKKLVSPHEGLLVLGQDWSSMVLYYSGLRGVAAPDWLPRDRMQRLLQRPEDFLGELTLGGIVSCPTYPYRKNPGLVQAFLQGRKEIAATGHCKLYAPRR